MLTQASNPNHSSRGPCLINPAPLLKTIPPELGASCYESRSQHQMKMFYVMNLAMVSESNFLHYLNYLMSYLLYIDIY